MKLVIDIISHCKIYSFSTSSIQLFLFKLIVNLFCISFWDLLELLKSFYHLYFGFFFRKSWEVKPLVCFHFVNSYSFLLIWGKWLIEQINYFGRSMRLYLLKCRPECRFIRSKNFVVLRTSNRADAPRWGCKHHIE